MRSVPKPNEGCNGRRRVDRNRAVCNHAAERREQARMDLAALKCDRALTAGRLAMGDPPTYDGENRAEQMGEAAIDEQNRMAEATAMHHHARAIVRRLVTARRRAPRARARAPRRAAAATSAASGAGSGADGPPSEPPRPPARDWLEALLIAATGRGWDSVGEATCAARAGAIVCSLPARHAGPHRAGWGAEWRDCDVVSSDRAGRGCRRTR
jgi:hypothetical protein